MWRRNRRSRDLDVPEMRTSYRRAQSLCSCYGSTATRRRNPDTDRRAVWLGAHLRDQRDVADAASLNMRPRTRAPEIRVVQVGSQPRLRIAIQRQRTRTSPCGSLETWCHGDDRPVRSRCSFALCDRALKPSSSSNVARKAGGWPKLNILGRQFAGAEYDALPTIASRLSHLRRMSQLRQRSLRWR